MQGFECSSLFVYGTLMRGRVAYGLIAPWVRSVRPAALRGRLFDLPEGYPGLVQADDAGLVFGEVLGLAEDVPWAKLDHYEGHDPADPEGSLYLRIVASVRIEGGGEVPAWCYVMRAGSESSLLERGARPLQGGRWPPPHLPPRGG